GHRTTDDPSDLVGASKRGWLEQYKCDGEPDRDRQSRWFWSKANQLRDCGRAGCGSNHRRRQYLACDHRRRVDDDYLFRDRQRGQCGVAQDFDTEDRQDTAHHIWLAITM